MVMKPNRYKVRKSSAWKLNSFFNMGFKYNNVLVRICKLKSWTISGHFNRSWLKSFENTWIRER